MVHREQRNPNGNEFIMVMNLYSALSMYIYSNALYKYVIYEQRPDHNTGNYVPYSLR